MLFGELYLKNKDFEGIEYLVTKTYLKRSLILRLPIIIVFEFLYFFNVRFHIKQLFYENYNIFVSFYDESSMHQFYSGRIYHNNGGL